MVAVECENKMLAMGGGGLILDQEMGVQLGGGIRELDFRVDKKSTSCFILWKLRRATGSWKNKEGA